MNFFFGVSCGGSIDFVHKRLLLIDLFFRNVKKSFEIRVKKSDTHKKRVDEDRFVHPVTRLWPPKWRIRPSDAAAAFKEVEFRAYDNYRFSVLFNFFSFISMFVSDPYFLSRIPYDFGR